MLTNEVFPARRFLTYAASWRAQSDDRPTCILA